MSDMQREIETTKGLCMACVHAENYQPNMEKEPCASCFSHFRSECHSWEFNRELYERRKQNRDKEKTCRTCKHWGAIKPYFGKLCENDFSVKYGRGMTADCSCMSWESKDEH